MRIVYAANAILIRSPPHRQLERPGRRLYLGHLDSHATHLKLSTIYPPEEAGSSRQSIAAPNHQCGTSDALLGGGGDRL